MFFLETLFVGVYTAIIIIFLSLFIEDMKLLFFTTGFLKHFLGYYLNIHGEYCKIYRGENYIATPKNLLSESFLEGMAFLTAGEINKNSINLPEFGFLTGCTFHVLSEILYIHDYYKNTDCVLK
jgi:hypothetical protein